MDNTALPKPLARLRLRRGQYLDDPPADQELVHIKRLEAALPQLDETSYFAHASAALIHGLPVFAADLDRVHVLHTGGSNGRISAVTHEYKTPKEPPNLTLVDGVRVTTLARTASDMMRRTLFGPSLAIADAALRLGCERAELLAEVKGGRGCRHATEAAKRADALSESPYESLVRATILQRGLPLPLLQHEFSDAWGFVGRVDFYWPRFRLVGEFDGRVKYTSLLAPGETLEDVLHRQQVRQERMEALNLRFVRWDADAVHTPGAIEASVRRYIGDGVIDHGLCPEAHDYRRPRRRAA